MIFTLIQYIGFTQWKAHMSNELSLIDAVEITQLLLSDLQVT